MLAVIEHQDALVVDSRLIAEELGISHEAFMKTIKKYESKVEQRFGCIRFEIGVPDSPTGNPPKYALLTESQATALMTFSRNTDQVIECKLKLVEAFEQAKQVIKQVIPAQQQEIEYLRLQLELEKTKLASKQLDQTMLAMHGKEITLALRGQADQLVRVETVITEVVNPITHTSERIYTAEQLKAEITKRTGQKIPSLKWFTEQLHQLGRDDLLVPVTRSTTNEYITPDKLEEAIALVFGQHKQLLITEQTNR
ncbi:MAG TPA: Rha family transcriptional regulator [Nostocaceae cyanobacterium]|nr:Rha family transcriptional regulator [Nostocaceae cyanobacterium]